MLVLCAQKFISGQEAIANRHHILACNQVFIVSFLDWPQPNVIRDDFFMLETMRGTYGFCCRHRHVAIPFIKLPPQPRSNRPTKITAYTATNEPIQSQLTCATEIFGAIILNFTCKPNTQQSYSRIQALAYETE